jgi:putative ABC transport system permease protein
MANRFWPGDDPIGKRFRFGLPGENSQSWLTVIGVVADTLLNGPESQPLAHFYMPLSQRPWFGSMEVVVRTASINPEMLDNVRRAIRSVSQTVPRPAITTVESRLYQLSARRRANTLLLSLFSGLSITLASVGLYALVHYSVVRRTREIGIRMALGAQPAGVVRMILWEGITLASIGMAAGFAGAMLLAELLSIYLYGISAHDPAVFAGVIAMILVVVIAACTAPASKAARIAPARALKYE